MFGYIRPLQGELKVRELERFKACYCGLCRTLGRRYGLTARFILNYELVFLSMLLWDDSEPLKTRRNRCIASPCKRVRYCYANPAFNKCAGYNVILAWWKLRDSITDESFFKSVPHRVLKFFLSGAYKKAASSYPEFDGTVKKELGNLTEHETLGHTSLDGAADCFAKILSAAVPEDAPDTTRRPMLEMLYHLGRWIYILDACDDYKEDIKAGRYNPVITKFSASNGELAGDSTERLKTTLAHSNNLLCSAFELLPSNTWSQIIRNIIFLGMPDICLRVFDRDRRRERNAD